MRNPQFEPIHLTVKETYRQVALNQESCCSISDCCGSMLYDAGALQGIPVDAVQASRGCGNPQAIAALMPGEVVLDLGSGGGIDVFMAAQQVGETGYVYGVDMTEEMIALARRNAELIGATNVAFRHGMIEQLPIDSHHVDVIISNCVIKLTPDKSAAFAEAFRVLRTGGRLAISDVVIDGVLHDLPVSEAEIRASLNWAGCVAGALTTTELVRLLSDVGFVDVRVEMQSHYTVGDLYGQMPATLANLDAATVRELVGRFGSANIHARKL
ncbi:MAG: arsenite methyltransferase [Chloroflexi bacterium]|nr:arsenite methyltransferase [Chloroflexota bacterium]